MIHRMSATYLYRTAGTGAIDFATAKVPEICSFVTAGGFEPALDLRCWRLYREAMQVLSIPLVLLSVSLIAVACTKKAEQPAEKPQVDAPTEAEPPVPSPDMAGGDMPPLPPSGLPADAPPPSGFPTEEPPPPAADHRLQLGVDGDPGYTEQELTPAELAKVRSEGERASEPSYAGQPSQPSEADQPSEPSNADEPSEASDEEYLREPLYRERRRERLPVERAREPSPVDREREPVRTEPARGGRR